MTYLRGTETAVGGEECAYEHRVCVDVVGEPLDQFTQSSTLPTDRPLV